MFSELSIDGKTVTVRGHSMSTLQLVPVEPILQDDATEALMNSLLLMTVAQLQQLVSTFDPSRSDTERWPMVVWIHDQSMDLGLRGIFVLLQQTPYLNPPQGAPATSAQSILEVVWQELRMQSEPQLRQTFKTNFVQAMQSLREETRAQVLNTLDLQLLDIDAFNVHVLSFGVSQLLAAQQEATLVGMSQSYGLDTHCLPKIHIVRRLAQALLPRRKH